MPSPPPSRPTPSPQPARVLAALVGLSGLAGCTAVWNTLLERDLTADLTLVMGEAGVDPHGIECAAVSSSRRGHCSLGVRGPEEIDALAQLLELTATPMAELAIGQQDACLSRPEHGTSRKREAWVGSRLPEALAPLAVSGPLGQLVLVRDTDSGHSCISAAYLYG